MNNKKFKTYFNIFVEMLIAFLWVSSFIICFSDLDFFSISDGINFIPALASSIFPNFIWLLFYVQLQIFSYLHFSQFSLNSELRTIWFKIILLRLHWIKISLSILFTALIYFLRFYPDNNLILPLTFTGIFVISIFGLMVISKQRRKIWRDVADYEGLEIISSKKINRIILIGLLFISLVIVLLFLKFYVIQ